MLRFQVSGFVPTVSNFAKFPSDDDVFVIHNLARITSVNNYVSAIGEMFTILSLMMTRKTSTISSLLEELL